MGRDKSRPTESEVQILGVLWKRGPSTVREVQQQLGWDTGYTTVLKFMQIMTEKGLLLRQRKGKQHVYRPAAPRERLQKHLVGDLIERAFGGSLPKLMVAALSSERASAQDLAEIRKLIDDIEIRGTKEQSLKKGDEL
jgi:predicted transcriptional regulator